MTDNDERDADAAQRPSPRIDNAETSTLRSISLGDSGESQDVGLSSQDVSAIQSLPDDSAILVVLRGPAVGSRFLLDADSTSAGRDPGSDIFLDDVTVSRRHAVFVRVPAGFVVRDTGSLNGTYVGRDRIEEHPLSDGDEVQIGKFRLTFHSNVDSVSSRPE